MDKLTKNVFKIVIILGISFNFFNTALALDYFQKTTIDNNKTGTIRIQYSAKNSELNGADVFKTLPFKEDKIRTAFGSDNNKIQSVTINPNKDGNTNVLVVLKFKYIGKLNTAPYFSNVKLTYFVSGDSTSFIYELPKNDTYPAGLNPVYTFELPTEKIMKTSGTIKDNSVVYGLTTEKLKNGVTLFATFKNSDKKIASNDKENKKSGDDKKEKEEGSCGLFGIELPLILGLGYAFNRKFKKKK